MYKTVYFKHISIVSIAVCTAEIQTDKNPPGYKPLAAAASCQWTAKRGGSAGHIGWQRKRKGADRCLILSLGADKMETSSGAEAENSQRTLAFGCTCSTQTF